MTLSELSELVKGGTKYGGLRLDHKKLATPDKIADVISALTVPQIYQSTSYLDLKLMYYHLTGKEPPSCGLSRQGMATKIWGIVREMRK